MVRRLVKKWMAHTLAAVWALLLFSACPLSQQAGTEFVTTTADWLPQDYVDSRGIVSVANANGRLVLEADMKGQDPERSSGEILLDLRYYPGLESQVPLDLSDEAVTVQLWVPATFAGPTNAPNGIQVFVKDAQWGTCYSKWVNVTRGGNYRISMRPGEGDENIVTPGFGPTRVRTLGVKFGMNARNRDLFCGTIIVTSITITPPVTFSPPPDLPAQPPAPLSATERFELREDGFYREGQRRFLVGANWQPIAYGQNFGATAWFPLGNGISRRTGFVRTNLDYAARAGVHVVRVGLLDDGRAALDADARVVGCSELFRQDVQALLDMARDLGCRIEFVLMDYQIAGQPEVVDGVLLRGRSQLLHDAETRAAFIAEFLEPFLDDFGTHPGLFGIDLINEPEWLVSHTDGGAWEDADDPSTKPSSPIPGADLAAFIAASADTIHARAPHLFVTVGVSAPFIGLVEDAGLDYLAVHHYPWMGDFPDALPPLSSGIPWMLEEYPTRSTPLTVTEYLDGAVSAGAVGAMLWNLTPELDEYAFTHAERNPLVETLRYWVENL